MVSSSNNGINDTVGASISGVTNTLTITNGSNTASSAARATVVVGGGTAADPTVNWNVSGVTNWEMGIDNSDSDKWKLSQGTALGTNDTIVAFTAGQVLKPLQPAFLAYLSANALNVTGDATNYQIAYDTVIYDIGSNFTTGASALFTAPVAGVYAFSTSTSLSGLTIAHTKLIWSFQATGSASGVLRYAEINPAAVRTNNNTFSLSGSMQIKLGVGDTVSVQGAVFNGTKVVNVQGLAINPPAVTWFSGYLLG